MLEFLHGLIIFPSSAQKWATWTDEDEHLARIIEVLGPFPSSLLRKGRLSAEFFHETGMLPINSDHRTELPLGCVAQC